MKNNTGFTICRDVDDDVSYSVDTDVTITSGNYTLPNPCEYSHCEIGCASCHCGFVNCYQDMLMYNLSEHLQKDDLCFDLTKGVRRNVMLTNRLEFDQKAEEVYRNWSTQISNSNAYFILYDELVTVNIYEVAAKGSVILMFFVGSKLIAATFESLSWFAGNEAYSVEFIHWYKQGKMPEETFEAIKTYILRTKWDKKLNDDK